MQMIKNIIYVLTTISLSLELFVHVAYLYKRHQITFIINGKYY